ncbi:MAG: 16S rRNA (cytosine1402-N4)-methyltransferase [Candidatus Midichloriaceae bacterium]|jgi:16S rRNA (cytosine1402-N4)-methyltransferase
MLEKKDHISVLIQEIVNAIQPSDGKTYVDATFGAGGYSESILNSANCKVIAIDCDDFVLSYADKLQAKFPERFKFFRSNFTDIDQVLENESIDKVDGVVFDLGVSSMQLDNKDRGFSFDGNADLDMRMDNRLEVSAYNIVNSWSEKELAEIIYYYGGERKSRVIAKNIINFRKKQKVKTTSDLIKAMGVKSRSYNDNIHFATRTFQALRIAVNAEMDNLQDALKKIPNLLNIGGVLSVVSFHSLEDKIVKDFYKKISKEEQEASFELINKKIITASLEELRSNNRSRSAKLRSIMRIK